MMNDARLNIGGEPRRSAITIPGDNGSEIRPSGKSDNRVHLALGYKLKKHRQSAVAFEGHWYQPVPGKVTWDEAQRRCQGAGGYLVCIESQVEAEFVARLTKSRKFIWLGGLKKPDGQWHWVNGAPMTFYFWARNEPGGSDVEDRLETWDGGRWNDVPGNHQRDGFVCEWEF